MLTRREVLTCSQSNIRYMEHNKNPLCGMVRLMYPVEKFSIYKVKQLYYNIITYCEVVHIRYLLVLTVMTL
jgi:hypothetical protein